MANLETVVSNTLVPHAAFEKALRRVKQCFRYSKGRSEATCVLVCGESGTGKSRVLAEVYEENTPFRNAGGVEAPILRITLPSKPSSKGLAEEMLNALGDPLFDRGTERAKTARLRKLVESTKTKSVMIDEFQHFQDRSSLHVIQTAADWLKTLVDQTGLGLVVAGLPRCVAVLMQNEQLRRWFMAPVHMPRFSWANGDDQEEFCAILGAFQESLSAHFDIPPIGAEEMGFRAYCATGGLIGYVTKLLQQAVCNAIDDRRKIITLMHLAEAHAESICDDATLPAEPNPFSRRFIARPTEELLKRVSSIGAEAVPEPARVSRRSRSPPQVPLNHVLSAR